MSVIYKGFTPIPIIEPKRSRNKLVRGFTLLEILVAALIMAMVMTGLACIFFAGKRHILHTRSKIQAAELGRLFLAPFQMQVDQSQWGNNCLSNTGNCNDETQTFYNPRIDYTATYTTSPVGSTNLRKVIVNITWTELSP